MTRRRPQQERRTETIGKLLDATIDCLADSGYAGTTTARVCARAGLSQGALFNHFASRLDLIVAATERIGDAHVADFERLASPRDADAGDRIDALIAFVHGRARTPRHAAWHEVMVAARTDAELRARVAGPLEAFEQALLAATRRVLAPSEQRAARVGMIVLSCLHMFDSEAVTSAVYPNPGIEAARAAWAADLLRTELAR
jgi:AcrR family transcriptional regulator